MTTTATMETRMEQQAAASPSATQIVVCLGAWYTDLSPEQLQPLLDVLRKALEGRAASALIAFPASDAEAGSWQQDGLSLLPYQPIAKVHALSVQTSASYLNLFEIMRTHSALCGLLLGAEAHSLQAETIRGLLDAVLTRNADIALPRYSIGANDGLINAAILHPLTRSLFGTRAAFPMALDIALSLRAAEKLGAVAQQHSAPDQAEELLWPTTEAAVAGFSIAEVTCGEREFPHPATADLSELLSTFTASLFSDVEAKASFWQRTRPVPAILTLDGGASVHVDAEPVSPEEISEMVDSFRIGYGNLHELWALVLPPQTLLGLKRLSRLPAEAFVMPDALWVRIVYDFVLAHRLRTINRGHLLGALTPLYLAWVASHIQSGNSNGNPPETLARAFDADKPYLVSRWRWPDRFNP